MGFFSLSPKLVNTHRALDRWPLVAWCGRWLNARRRMGTLWLGGWTLRQNGQRSNRRTERRMALQCLCAAIIVTFTRSQLIVDCLTNRVAHEQGNNSHKLRSCFFFWGALFSLPLSSYYRARGARLWPNWTARTNVWSLAYDQMQTNGVVASNNATDPNQHRTITLSLVAIWFRSKMAYCVVRSVHIVHIREFVTKISTENERLIALFILGIHRVNIIGAIDIVAVN